MEEEINQHEYSTSSQHEHFIEEENMDGDDPEGAAEPTYDHKETVRNFCKVQHSIETIGGLPIIVDLWSSQERPRITKRAAEPEVPTTFTCQICDKVFDENRKLLLHKRYHKEVKPILVDGKKKEELSKCDICGKEFDGENRLKLHRRYHKVG